MQNSGAEQPEPDDAVAAGAEAGHAVAPGPPAHRPPPPRPEFRVEPRHPAADDTPPRTMSLARWAWVASFAVLFGIAAATALDLTAVRTALETALAQQSPTTSHRDISDAVSLTLLVSAGVAAILLVAALICLQLLRARHAGARIALAVVGVLSAGAAVAFWSLLADAASATGGVLQWAPLVYAGLVLVGTATLFAPAVGTWLRAPRR
ncbi:hypothetical protein [Rhodococcus sp. NPDC127528]|uniref:hypothetical protein n=1 Tax=unclassified Rhodococcus (in: high G+C Gram-positive bacteria) TaxID=192944 RepID=UPI00363AC754